MNLFSNIVKSIGIFVFIGNSCYANMLEPGSSGTTKRGEGTMHVWQKMSAINNMHFQLEEVELTLSTGHWEKSKELLKGFVKSFPEEKKSLLDSNLLLLDDRKKVVLLLADLYWHLGEYNKLRKITEKYMGEEPKSIWNCRILEKTTVGQEVTTCWNNIGQTNRTLRSIRENVVSEMN